MRSARCACSATPPATRRRATATAPSAPCARPAAPACTTRSATPAAPSIPTSAPTRAAPASTTRGSVAFLQRDPAGAVDGTNLYTYAGNNPLSFADPSGLGREERVASAAEDQRVGSVLTYFAAQRLHLEKVARKYASIEESAQAFTVYREVLTSLEKSALSGKPVDVETLWRHARKYDWGWDQRGWMFIGRGSDTFASSGPFFGATVAGVDGAALFGAVISDREPNPSLAKRIFDQATLAIVAFGPGMAGGFIEGEVEAGVLEGTGAFRAGTMWTGERLGVLAGRELRVSARGIGIVEEHLSQPAFLEGGTMYPHNAAMIERVRDALDSGIRIHGADASFYMHEVHEATLMARGVPYDAAHAQALAKYRVSPFSVYHAEVVRRFASYFNSEWLRFWSDSGLLR